jgi:signal peptidase II
MPDATPDVKNVSQPVHWRETGLVWLWLSVAVIAIDQLTKLWAVSMLSSYEPVPVIPFLNMTLAFNTGAAFSFLGDAGGWQQWFFIGLALGISVFLIVWLAKNSAAEIRTNLSLSLLLGGAIGNAIDRIIAGRVTDFIDFYIGLWHYPTFNIADIAITLGALLMIWDAWKSK